MAVKIRLMRVGKTKQPTYRVVVADARSPRDGRILETIGHYGPRQEPSAVDINGERALAWLRQGAQPTEQVQKLLTMTGVWATFESEKTKPIVTKLNRTAYKTGRGAPAPKAPTKPIVEAAAEAPAPVAEEATAEAEVEAPAAEISEPAVAEAEVAEAEAAEAGTDEETE